jgi:hypothetical protein
MTYYYDEILRAYIVSIGTATLTIPEFQVLEEQQSKEPFEDALERIATDRLKYGD